MGKRTAKRVNVELGFFLLFSFLTALNGQVEVIGRDGVIRSAAAPPPRRSFHHSNQQGRQYFHHQRREPLATAEVGGVTLTNVVRDFGSKAGQSPSLFLNIPQRNDTTHFPARHSVQQQSSSEEQPQQRGKLYHPMPVRIYDDQELATTSSPSLHSGGSGFRTTVKSLISSSSASSSRSSSSIASSVSSDFSNNLIKKKKVNNNSNHRLEETTVKSLTSHRTLSRNTQQGKVAKGDDDLHDGREPQQDFEEDEDGGPTDFRMHMMGGFLKREVWTIPLLSMASLNIFLISLFEVYVLCKARGPSRRHLFLGQMLLFGLFLSSSLAVIFAICPSAIGCFLGRIGVGISYTIILSVLMVKCIFLLSLDGGVYLPASYQACLLLFSILVQVAIDTQWVIVYPPTLEINSSGGPLWTQCGTSYGQFLLTLSYNVFLIVVVGFLSFKTRGIRENYRESTYIGVSILVTVPIWVSWTVAGWILQGRHQDACVGFGLLTQSLATFLIMFTPKGRQLAAMGKEGLFLEDQEDQGSGYSPSFFHFKPAKSYKTALIGDMLPNGPPFYRFMNDYNGHPFLPYLPRPSTPDGNVYTTLEPTISTVNPNVFFHRSDFHPGMIY